MGLLLGGLIIHVGNTEQVEAAQCVTSLQNTNHKVNGIPPGWSGVFWEAFARWKTLNPELLLREEKNNKKK